MVKIFHFYCNPFLITNYDKIINQTRISISRYRGARCWSMGSEVGAERRWGVEKGINGRGGGQIKLVLNCYINNIEQMGNFTGF